VSRRLGGRAALITGGASGIGLATARLLLEEGAKVMIADTAADAAAQDLSRLGDVHAVNGDVALMADGARRVAEAIQMFGVLDVALLAAGWPRSDHRADRGEWDHRREPERNCSWPGLRSTCEA
jgi:NAD(P)-dependent dehydrogenase (short-subunit alcohol dehydrogenase family)